MNVSGLRLPHLLDLTPFELLVQFTRYVNSADSGHLQHALININSVLYWIINSSEWFNFNFSLASLASSPLRWLLMVYSKSSSFSQHELC